MLYINLMGGLGNQLFQIFALINLSLELKIPFKLPVNKRDKVSPADNKSKRPTYWNNIFKYLEKFTIQFEEQYILINEREDSLYYNLSKLALESNKNYKLNGYFQSEKYFINNYDNIKKLCRINKIQEIIREKYNELLDNSTSLHFRIGDYVVNPHIHPILSIDYYINAIKKLQELEKINKIIYFFERTDLDIVNKNIKHLKSLFIDIEFIPCPNNLDDWQELILMSCCKNHIIANSTFSWWGAYLNSYDKKLICYPSIWFGNKFEKNPQDIFPESWIII